MLVPAAGPEDVHASSTGKIVPVTLQRDDHNSYYPQHATSCNLIGEMTRR